MNGAARIMNYVQYGTSKKYLFTMYEGWVKESDPSFFGRAIAGYGNFAFVGYFRECHGHGFWCTTSSGGNGLFFKYDRKEKSKFKRVVKFSGTYDEGNNW